MKVLIKFLKNIFSRKKEVEDSDIDDNLACAILLVEVSYSDFDIDSHFGNCSSSVYFYGFNDRIYEHGA